MEVFEGLNLRKQVLLSISCPKQNYFVSFLFHLLNILPQFINYFLISTLEYVVGSVSLVGCYEFAVESSWERHDSLQLSLKLLDQVRLEDLRSLTCFPSKLIYSYISSERIIKLG